MTQPTLYDGNSPHVAGSATSKAAGQSVDRPSLRQQVYWHIQRRTNAQLLRNYGGVTDDEIEVALRMRHQTASARRRELVLLGKVKDSGRKRATRSGRQATVWVTV